MKPTDEQVEQVAEAMWASRGNANKFAETPNTSLVAIYRNLARAALSVMPAPDATAIRAAALREALGKVKAEASRNPEGDIYDEGLRVACMAIEALIDHPAPAPAAEARENIVDEIESIISGTHDMDVRDIDYAENVVAWLERHHPVAWRALSGG